MTQFAKVWHFTRARLEQAMQGLTHEQMCWRPHSEAHTIFELLYHIAGAEYYWANRLGNRPPQSEFERRLDRAVIESFLAEGEFPFGTEDLTDSAVRSALRFSYDCLRPIIEEPSAIQLAMSLVSPVGDEVDGHTGLIRIAQHAGYHTGQIWLMKMDPRFPGTRS